ncbi:MAG: hypothetical protein RR821_06330, partial [Clostridia bacterium]
AFLQEHNAEKRYFIHAFKQLWSSSMLSSDMDASESLKGFQLLKETLTINLKELEGNNKTIAKTHTVKFLEFIDEITHKITCV